MWICVHNVLNYIDLTQLYTKWKYFILFYIMNGVPEAQSENIKFSDALQGDSQLHHHRTFDFQRIMKFLRREVKK